MEVEMTTGPEVGNRKRGITQPQGNLSDWLDDPEYQRACREAEAIGAMVPNFLDWAAYQAAKRREK
jgi:hypothetical protein